VYVFGLVHVAAIPSRSQRARHPFGWVQLITADVDVVVPDGAETNASVPPFNDW
jgi:hypothetical protein